MSSVSSKRKKATYNATVNPSPFAVNSSPFITQSTNTGLFPPSHFAAPLANPISSLGAPIGSHTKAPCSDSPNQAQLALLQALTRLSGNNNSSHKKSKNKKKKKSKKSNSSSSSSSPESTCSDSDSSSSNNDPSTNWSLLKNVWPVEKRHIGPQNKHSFNSIDLNNLLSIARLDRENLKALDGDLSSSFNPFF